MDQFMTVGGTLALGALAFTAVLGTFFLQSLANRKESQIRHAFERGAQIVRRLLELHKTGLIADLEEADRAEKNSKETPGGPSVDSRELDELKEFISADLSERDLSDEVVHYICSRLPRDRRKDNITTRNLHARQVFIDLWGKLVTERPELVTLHQLCKEISDAAGKYTNQPSSKALDYIAEDIEDLQEAEKRARVSLKGALISLASACLIWLVSAIPLMSTLLHIAPSGMECPFGSSVAQLSGTLLACVMGLAVIVGAVFTGVLVHEVLFHSPRKRTRT